MLLKDTFILEFCLKKYDYQLLLLNIPKFQYKPKKLKKTEKLFAIGTENLQILNIGIWYRTYIYIFWLQLYNFEIF